MLKKLQADNVVELTEHPNYYNEAKGAFDLSIDVATFWGIQSFNINNSDAFMRSFGELTDYEGRGTATNALLKKNFNIIIGRCGFTRQYKHLHIDSFVYSTETLDSMRQQYFERKQTAAGNGYPKAKPTIAKPTVAKPTVAIQKPTVSIQKPTVAAIAKPTVAAAAMSYAQAALSTTGIESTIDSMLNYSWPTLYANAAGLANANDGLIKDEGKVDDGDEYSKASDSELRQKLIAKITALQPSVSVASDTKAEEQKQTLLRDAADFLEDMDELFAD